MLIESSTEIGILLIALALFWCATYRRLVWGIYIIVFFIPTYLIRMDIFGLPATFLELLIYLTFVIYFIKGKDILGSVRGIVNNPIISRIILPIFLIMAGVTASTVLSRELEISAGQWKALFVDPLMLFLLMVVCIKNRSDLRNLLLSFVFSCSVVSVIGFAYWFNGILEYDSRLSAFYNSANYLAMYLVPGLIIALIFLFNGIKRHLMLISSFLISISLFFTYSYGAWIGFLAAAAFFLIIRFQKKSAWAILAVAVLGLALFASQYSNNKFVRLISLDDHSSLNSRLIIWRSSFKILEDNFLLGIGPGMFQQYYLEYQKYFPPYLEWAVPLPHNVFIAFWLGGGIMAAAGFIWLVAYVFKIMFAIQKKRLQDLLYAHLSGALMVYFLVHGAVDTTYWKNDLAIVFWLGVFPVMFVGIKRYKRLVISGPDHN